MKFETLLDKREFIQVELIRQLMHEKGRISAQELCQRCKISRPSLESYLIDLEDLGTSLGKEIKIKRDGNDILFGIDFSLSFNEIIEFLLLQSTKFNLLKLLLKNEEYSSLDLSEKLMVSESTLFRKIRELNISLGEFNLKIKNNKISGSEEQIRFFYFQLFSFLNVEERPYYLQATERKDKFIARAEEILRVKFSEMAKEQIAIWLGVSRQRTKFPWIEKSFILKQKEIYQNDHLYQLLDALFYQKVYKTSESEPCETMLFYSFFVSSFILTMEDYYRFTIFQSKQIPVVMLNITIREKLLAYYQLRRLGIDDEKALEYQLAQVNNRFYFFSGNLSFDDPIQLLSTQKTLIKEELRNHLVDLVQEANALTNKEKISESSTQMLSYGYGNAMILLENSFTQNIIIQYDFQNSPFYQITLEQMLKNQLRGIDNLKIEPFKIGSAYDLLIVSNPKDMRKDGVYLSEITTACDLEKIKVAIEHMKLAKKSS